MAAAVYYFHLSSLKDIPTKNAISPSTDKDAWIMFKHAVERIKESYVMVNELLLDQDSKPLQLLTSFFPLAMVQ